MYVGHVGKDLRPAHSTIIPCLHLRTNIRLHHSKQSAPSNEDGNHFSDFQERRGAHAEMHTTMPTSRLMKISSNVRELQVTTHSSSTPARKGQYESSPVSERQNYKYHRLHPQGQKSLIIKDSGKLQLIIFATGCPICLDFILDSRHSQLAVR